MFKIAVIFYSFSGSTRRACEFLRARLIEQEGNITLVDLKLEKEEKYFLKQCKNAYYKTTPAILNGEYNLSDFDFIVFASPVWAFTFTPALRTFLTKAEGLNAKRIACFFTHILSLGTKRALAELEEILRLKQAHVQFSKSISGAKTKNPEYLEKQFKELLEIAKP